MSRALLLLPLALTGCDLLLDALAEESTDDPYAAVAVTTTWATSFEAAVDDAIAAADDEDLNDLPVPGRWDGGVSSRVYLADVSLEGVLDGGVVAGESLTLEGCEQTWTYAETEDGRYDYATPEIADDETPPEPCPGPFTTTAADLDVVLPATVPVDFDIDGSDLLLALEGSPLEVPLTGLEEVDSVLAVVIDDQGEVVWTNEPTSLDGWLDKVEDDDVTETGVLIVPPEGLPEAGEFGTLGALIVAGLSRTEGVDLAGVNPASSMVLAGRTRLAALSVQVPDE